MGIAEVITAVIKIVCKVIAYCLGIGLWLAASVLPWRLPFVCRSMCNQLGKNVDDGHAFEFLAKACGEFAKTVFDCITVPMGIVALVLPWRLPYVLGYYFNSKTWSENDEGWHPQLRLAFVVSFFQTVADLIALAMLPVALSCPWRWPFVIKSLINNCPSPWVKKGDYDGVMGYYKVEFRWYIILQTGLSIFDWFCVPFVLVGFVRWYYLFKEWCRCASCKAPPPGGGGGGRLEEGMKMEAPKPAAEEIEGFEDCFDNGNPVYYFWKNRKAVFENFLKSFVDMLFLPCFLVVLLSGYRSWVVVGLAFNQLDEKGEKDEVKGRLQALWQFFELLIDLPCIIMWVVVTATVWRAYPMNAELSDKYNSDIPNLKGDLQAGMEVEVNLAAGSLSKYFRGLIQKKNADGTYVVDMFDTLEEGMKVEARYRGRSRYYPGKISRAYPKIGRYDIVYDDGEREMGVREELIKVLEPASGGGSGGSTAIFDTKNVPFDSIRTAPRAKVCTADTS